MQFSPMLRAQPAYTGDFVSICGAGEVCFTTVNVQHMQIWVTVVRINDLHKFAAQLFCQQNTRSNNNSRHTITTTIHGRLCIHDHSQGFSTTGGNNHLTFVVILKTVNDAFLMRAKGDHQKEIDVNSIKPPERCVKRVLGDPRHYWDGLEGFQFIFRMQILVYLYLCGCP